VLATGDEKAFSRAGPALPRHLLAGGACKGATPSARPCLNRTGAARKAGLLTEGKLDPASLAQRAGAFARFSDPQAVLDEEHKTLVGMASELRAAGYANLAAFVDCGPRNGHPLLLSAARYFFFRRAIETDEALFQGLAFSRLEQLQESTDSAFASLEGALETALLVLEEVKAAVLDVRAEQLRQASN